MACKPSCRRIACNPFGDRPQAPAYTSPQGITFRPVPPSPPPVAAAASSPLRTRRWFPYPGCRRAPGAPRWRGGYRPAGCSGAPRTVPRWVPPRWSGTCSSAPPSHHSLGCRQPCPGCSGTAAGASPWSPPHRARPPWCRRRPAAWRRGAVGGKGRDWWAVGAVGWGKRRLC